MMNLVYGSIAWDRNTYFKGIKNYNTAIHVLCSNYIYSLVVSDEFCLD